MRRIAAILISCATLAACDADGTVEEDTPPAAGVAPADSLTAEQQRARRDSAVAGSQLPGAAGVGRAMEAADAARARAEATDTMLD